MKRAEVSLSNYDLTDDEVNSVVQEWSAHTFKPGDIDMALAKLEMIAAERVLRKHGLYDSHRASMLRETLIVR